MIKGWEKMIGIRKYSKKEVMEFLTKRSNSNAMGALSDYDILQMIYDREIIIYPYDEKLVTPIGYNFCPSEVIISTRTGLPIKIRQKGNEKYIIVSAHDTVLISTREYLSISNNIMGTFHSRVSVVSAGFGHISTTLDPGWRGPLLIALNNPSSHNLKLVISYESKPIPFVTLVFYRFSENARKLHDNPPYRTDILEKYQAKPNWVKRKILGKSYENYRDMVYLICDSMKIQNVSEDTNPLLNKLEKHICDLKNSYITREKNEAAQRIAVEEIIRCIAVGDKNKEFSLDLTEILYNLYWGLTYFYLQDKTWHVKSRSFEEILLPYLDLCYMRIQDEKIGKFWDKKYEEIKNRTTAYKHRLGLILGLHWGRIIFMLLVMGALLWVIIGQGDFASGNVINDVVVPIFTTIVATVLLYFIMGK